MNFRSTFNECDPELREAVWLGVPAGCARAGGTEPGLHLRSRVPAWGGSERSGGERLLCCTAASITRAPRISGTRVHVPTSGSATTTMGSVVQVVREALLKAVREALKVCREDVWVSTSIEQQVRAGTIAWPWRSFSRRWSSVSTRSPRAAASRRSRGRIPLAGEARIRSCDRGGCVPKCTVPPRLRSLRLGAPARWRRSGAARTTTTSSTS